VLRIAMLLLVAAISTAQAQDGGGRAVIWIAGLSCGKWTNTPKQSAQHDAQRTWVAGFVSGMNFEATDGDFLRGKDFDGLIGWIDNYCRTNPLHDVVQAAVHLVQALRKGRSLIEGRQRRAG
jgi:hypothetical protein